MLYTREILKMAKVIVELDTEEGMLSVKINGKPVSDVESVMVGCYHDTIKDENEVMCDICTKRVDAGGVRTYTRICAEQSKDGANALALGTVRSEYDGFLINPVSKASKDTGEYVEARKSVEKAFFNIFGNRRDK